LSISLSFAVRVALFGFSGGATIVLTRIARMSNNVRLTFTGKKNKILVNGNGALPKPPKG
jgi:hypothetical protein